MVFYTFLVEVQLKKQKIIIASGPDHLSAPVLIPLFTRCCLSGDSPSPQTRDCSAPAWCSFSNIQFQSPQLSYTSKGRKKSPSHELSLGSPVFNLNPSWQTPEAFPVFAALLLSLPPKPWVQGLSLILCFNFLWLDYPSVLPSVLWLGVPCISTASFITLLQLHTYLSKQ